MQGIQGFRPSEAKQRSIPSTPSSAEEVNQAVPPFLIALGCEPWRSVGAP